MALTSRRAARGGASAYDTLFVDFAGKVTLRASLDARSATFKAADIQRIQTQGGGVRMQYFSPVYGTVNAQLSLSFAQVRDAFLRDYGRFTWKDE